MRSDLFARGWQAPQVAAELGRRLRVRPRIAWRYALGWPQWKLVMEYREVNPTSRLTESRVSEYESWPQGGTKPPLEYLAGLALTFGRGCTVADLVDDVDREHLSAAERLLVGPAVADSNVQASVTTREAMPMPASVAAPEPVPDVEDEAALVAQERLWLSSLDLDEAKLDYLDSAIEWIIDQDERVAPAELLRKARDLRSHVHRLLRRPHHPPARARLYQAAAYLSGTHAALSLDLGRVGAARAYAQESFDLATATRAPDLEAWARATQSLVEYYAGQFHDAFGFAQDGLSRSPQGVHAVRLAVNGQARALARLGDAQGVERAIDHGWSVLNERSSPDVELSASLTTGVYCEARTAGNAATAFLALGDVEQVERYATLALETFERTDARSPRAMTRIDLASALLRPEAPDPERGADLVREALTLTDGLNRFPVEQRAQEFLQAAGPWRTLPAIREVREILPARSAAGTPDHR
jgi:tetratricopeptide (TPR) repeat protein